MAVKNHAKTDTNQTFLLLSSFTGLFDFVPNILSGIVGSMTVSVPYFTALLFVDYRHWKFVRLYLLFLIMKAPLIIGGDKPFKNLYNFLARLSKLFWCIVFSIIISRMPRKVLTCLLWINLRARSWIRLIRLFQEREQNIHLSGQELSWDLMIELKSDSHIPENFCQIKIFPGLVQKKYHHLLVWCLKMKTNGF